MWEYSLFQKNNITNLIELKCNFFLAETKTTWKQIKHLQSKLGPENWDNSAKSWRIGSSSADLNREYYLIFISFGFRLLYIILG